MKSVTVGSLTKCVSSKTRAERLRSSSSDSGCDVLCDSLDIHDSPRHVSIKYCESRLQEIIKINLKQASQHSEDCKTSLKIAGEDEGGWRRQLSEVLELTANQIYWETKELKELLLYGSDHPPWQETSFVIQELEESPDDCSSCVTTDTDTDSLASWTNSDKSGVAWDFEEQINTELPCRSKRRSRVTDFDLKEIFWKISMENNPNTFLEEMHNLPSWESPDIFLDSEDDSEDNLTGREDSLEIFQFIKHIFNEPQEKSWNEEQKFGSSWDHHIKYYEVRAAEAPRSEKEWNQSQLDELIDSLDTVNLLVEPAITSTDQNKMLSIAQQDFNWSETAKFGSSWERHLGEFSDYSEYSHSESELPEKTCIWSTDKILQIIHRLQSVDFNESFLKDLVLNEDSVEIFEENKGIFEDNTDDFETAPSWSGEHRFGASWESFIPEYDGQDRNINWSFAHKFGLSWAEQLADIEEAAVKQLRKQVKQKRRKIVFDLLDIFWEIALDKRTALLEPKLCEILRNLPASEGPDVFLDSSLMFYEPAAPKNCVSQEEILDIFNTGRTIFAAIDNHDQEISICTEDEDIKKEQKDKKTKRSALVSIKKFFTRVKFTVERKKEKNFIQKKKIWWKKIRFPKLKRNDLE